MYRTALRSASRPVAAGLRTTVRAASRRFASTTPAEKPRSWKGSAVRLGLAFAAVYYYNTSPVFADEVTAQTIPAPASFTQDDLPTVDSVLSEKRKQIQSRPEQPAEKTPVEAGKPEAQTVAVEGGPAALEEEADQQGAFNPETGEINWDCPCLGGMAHGPCGEEFKTAFSCFVYSNEEPKGMDCIEKFQGMQECFKQYPEIYGAELADDEDDADAPATEGVAVDAQKDSTEAPVSEAKVEKPVAESIPARVDEAVSVTPKKAEDATPANGEVKEEPVKTEAKSEEKVEEKTEEQKA